MASSLTRYVWLSVGAAVVTIVMKAAAYYVTGSVGLLSDAIESFVNLAAALIALAMLTVASWPADELHAYGHYKAEYFSSAVEGALIVLAAGSIAAAAWPRLINPAPIEAVGLGLAISSAASLVNFLVARILLRAARRYGSIALEANGRHLMADVWTSAGVIVGVAGAAITGWQRLDPIVALLVAANVIWSGTQLVRRSAQGLLDQALPPAERAAIQAVLSRYCTDGVECHALRTRQAGRHRFVSFHVLVPGNWTVRRGHALLERVERDVRDALPSVTVFTHLEPREDPTSFDDTGLHRRSPMAGTEREPGNR